LRLLPDTSLDTSERNDRKTEERRCVVRRIIVALMLAALVALAAAGAASARTPITITTHDHKVTETVTGTLHCHPNERSIATVTANATLHITAAGRDAQGNLLPPFHTHSLFQGKFLEVPADGTGPTYTGHFIEIQTINARSLDEFVGTYTDIEQGTARGSDGSKVRMHVLVRYSVNAKGKVTVDFVKVKREC
jgi:hypothetical protein